ncbi:MAG: glycerophosphodiester phosphodiesterase [Actinomycetota bacterium]|nr:glycerophosphodiester phosphodiesterase [Actinomycetota bacterium]
MTRRDRGGTRFPFLEGPLPLAFVHRGGSGRGAENSLSAFSAAIELGYRYLETDVHTTSDDVAVVFHDPTLDRVTDRTGRIDRLPWSQVRKARIAGSEPIPRLDELLTAFPDLRINIDMKSPGAVPGVTRAIQRAGALDRVCVASFVDARVAAARRMLGPRLCTSLGRRGVAALRLASFSPRASALLGVRAACAQLPMAIAGRPLVDRRLLDTAHDLGMQVHVWTLNSPAEINYALDLGVDGIMTDAPTVLRDVLEDRGKWQSR